MRTLMHRYVVGHLLFLGVVLLSGCARMPPANVPMNTLLYAETGAQNRTLIVALPGLRERPAAYERRGFVDALRNRGLAVDLIEVDAHFGYYADRSVVERLKVDVVTPAREQGYDKIWLVGVSLGGFGSLLYAMHYPHDVEGMMILAPFLGEQELISEILKAGGPKNWQPGALSKEVGARELWAWLRNYYKKSNNLPPLYLGYGRSDKFRVANSLLASILPKKHVYVEHGWHNWWTWRRLWNKALDNGVFGED